MGAIEPRQGPILRIFQVQAMPGRATELLAKFRTTSAAVVDGHIGNQGYFFGQGVDGETDKLVFVSLWADIDAVKRRFGETWQNSYLPEGYEDLIANHVLLHIDATEGWHADVESSDPVESSQSTSA
ncbi:MAG: hypothetical protein JJ908_16025 [Rhizobiales bacterium]|nr:hypothetical protein [Hyphomicrobiales bacterium]MBO6699954.1 hypothetical protein [Hyphomicrobiales bacterium]MBO6737880.1 hypothetical protein [Hyphomicrobiales bacterium]MBO6913062.1 hypothetical protein [Hyphomicrobiales bacterium]MBO6956651.1 hypothetical protein [Hyphomicrobiales bacterium]